MIYIVDESNLDILCDGTVQVADGDSVKVFVKDMDAPIVSARSYNALKNMCVEFSEADSQLQVLFTVGCLVGNGMDVTIVQMELPIPEGYQDKVNVIGGKGKAKKASKPRSRGAAKAKKEKVETAPKSDAVATSEKTVATTGTVTQAEKSVAAESNTGTSDTASGETDASH